jgi:hypothetical protein
MMSLNSLPAAVLVSIPKCGTTLAMKAFGRFGYARYGWGARATRREPSEKALFAELMRTHPPYQRISEKYSDIEHEALFEFIESDILRRIEPVGSFVGRAKHPLQRISGLAAMVEDLPNTDIFAPWTVGGVHEIWQDEYVDTYGRNHRGSFLYQWMKDGWPKLIFNYRDPRDQLLSMMNFIMEWKVPHPLVDLYRPIFKSLESTEARISYAIRCPTFPFRNAYRRDAWLLAHPSVLKIRFEEIVGPEGGGDAGVQRDTIKRMIDFLGLTVDLDAIVEGLFGGTITFRQGKAAGWRDSFSAANLRAFESRYGDELELYGYT